MRQGTDCCFYSSRLWGLHPTDQTTTQKQRIYGESIYYFYQELFHPTVLQILPNKIYTCQTKVTCGFFTGGVFLTMKTSWNHNRPSYKGFKPILLGFI